MTTRLELVLGLGFGDEGKGTMVDWLARQGPPPLVLRYNGGPQAAHHVVVGDRVHCFAQLGSASFVDGARTHLCADMAVDLYALQMELAAFGAPAEVTIDPRCVVVTPWHAVVNRVRELARGAGRHGSTGRGVGEAKLSPDKLLVGHATAGATRAYRDLLLARARDLDVPAGARESAHELIEQAASDDVLAAYLEAAAKPIAVRETVPRAERIILESAQGAMLDRDHGFFPHVTPSRITRTAAEAELRALGLTGDLTVWGVLRAYYTRHGEGPFPTEDLSLAVRLPERHNREDGPAGRFRVGWFDPELARRAIGFAGPIDRLAITCLDRVADLPECRDITSRISRELARTIDVESWGPTAADKRAR